MIRSMTGFGEAVLDSDPLTATVSAKSVNHRYLELSIHVPRPLTPLEPEIKTRIQSRVRRGKVEVSVRATFRGAPEQRLEVSKGLVAGYIEALKEIQSEHRLAGEVTLSDVARFPGAVQVVEAPSPLGSGPRGEVLRLVGEALEALDRMRRAEGETLWRDLEAGLGAVRASLGRIATLSESGKADRRESLLEKTRALVSEMGLDDARLEAEIARLVDRQDVTEEIQRLRSHLDMAGDVLRDESEASGKRLDFVCQEMMREANTIGSKGASAPLIHEVVKLKSEIEKLREQVQNVE